MTWFPRNVTISSCIGCPSTYCLGDQLLVWGFTDILRCWNTIQNVMKMKNSARSRKMVWIYFRRTISTYICIYTKGLQKFSYNHSIYLWYLTRTPVPYNAVIFSFNPCSNDSSLGSSCLQWLIWTFRHGSLY